MNFQKRKPQHKAENFLGHWRNTYPSQILGGYPHSHPTRREDNRIPLKDNLT